MRVSFLIAAGIFLLYLANLAVVAISVGLFYLIVRLPL